MGAMQNPWTARAAASDAKDCDAAAQKHEIMRPIDVAMYTGLLPIFTARLLQTRLDTAIAAIHEPWRPRVKVCKGMPNSSASGTMADVKRGPIATRPH